MNTDNDEFIAAITQVKYIMTRLLKARNETKCQLIEFEKKRPRTMEIGDN